MTLATRLLASLDARLAGAPTPVFLGLSGGVDSMLLLDACHRLGIPLTAIHVHHGLQQDADRWADFCREQAQQRGLDFICENVRLDGGNNIEARARAARYAAFAKHAGQGSLLLAQHQDDQAETLLLRLMRGAGAQGLAGMAGQRMQAGVTLIRPLLDVSRAHIEQLARDWQLDWVEDPSNADARFERNWVRQQLLPAWQAHTPGIRQQLARSASHLGEAAQLLDELAEQDRAQLADGAPGLSLTALAALSPPRRANLLRHWLADKEPYRPGEDVLARLQQEVINARDDRQPQLPLENGVLTRYRQRLYWVPSAAFAPPPPAHLWHLDQPLQLGPLQLEASRETTAPSSPEIVVLSSCAPKGVAGSMHEPAPTAGHLHLPAILTQLQVRFAQGGERILRNGKHQQISECWRAAGIPPWLRRWLPLFYLDEELVAAAALGVADNWQPETSSATTIMAWRLQPDLTGC